MSTSETPLVSFNKPVEELLDGVAARGHMTFDDALNLSDAGLCAPGFGIIEIVGRQIGIASFHSVGLKIKRGMISASTLLAALKSFAPPAPVEGVVGLDAEAVGLLAARVGVAASLLAAAVETHGEVTRAEQSVVRDVVVADDAGGDDSPGDDDDAGS